MKKLLTAAVLAVALSGPVHAEFSFSDPVNFGGNTLIAIYGTPVTVGHLAAAGTAVAAVVALPAAGAVAVIAGISAYVASFSD